MFGIVDDQNAWNEYLAPMNALNLGIGGDCAKNLLRKAIDLPLPSSMKNIVILCRANVFIHYPCDLPDCIISIGSIFGRSLMVLMSVSAA